MFDLTAMSQHKAIYRHIKALVLRDFYLLRGSVPRLLSVLYWPALNILNFGFLNHYLSKMETGAHIVSGIMLGGAILWEILVRSQFGVLQPFLEEIWARNLGNVFVSPTRNWEYLTGLMILSLLRMGIAMIFCVVIADVVFGYSLLSLGLPLVVFVLNLVITGWWSGLLQIALMLRYGVSAEWLAWMAAYLISPVVAIFFPVSVLPEWLQAVSWCLPPTYIFEGMRGIMLDHVVHWDYALKALGLNLVYLGFGAIVYKRVFDATRRSVGILQIGSE